MGPHATNTELDVHNADGLSSDKQNQLEKPPEYQLATVVQITKYPRPPALRSLTMLFEAVELVHVMWKRWCRTTMSRSLGPAAKTVKFTQNIIKYLNANKAASMTHQCRKDSMTEYRTGINLLSYFCIAVSPIQNHNCVAVFDFDYFSSIFL